MVLSYFSGIFLRKSYTNRVIRTLFFGRVRTGSRIPEVVESHEIRIEKYNIGCKTQVMYVYSYSITTVPCSCTVIPGIDNAVLVPQYWSATLVLMASDETTK